MNPKKTQQYYVLDAVESIYFSGQLSKIRAQTYDYKLPNLRARELIPTAGDVSNWQQTLEWRSWGQIGVAKIISSYADDLPRVDVYAETNISRIKSLGDSYGYNVDEIRMSRATGANLDVRRATAARRAIDQLIDDILAVGDSSHGLVGFTNQPNAILYTVPNGAGGSATWALKTNEEILDDLVGIASSVRTATKDQEQPNTLALPDRRYTYISSRIMGDGDTRTILQTFLAIQDRITTVVPWTRLEGAGAGGTDRMVCYRRSPDALEAIVPQEFEQFPAQERGLEFVVPCHAKCGGVVLYYPLSMAYGDGI